MREPVKIRLAIAIDPEGHVVAFGMEPERMKLYEDAVTLLATRDLLGLVDGEPRIFFSDVMAPDATAGMRKAT